MRRALRITSAIRIDGVLDEDVWQRAEAASDFVQQDPRVNEPVSEATDVRVLVGDDAIYFGIVVFNQTTQPGSLGRDQRDRAMMLKMTCAFDF